MILKVALSLLLFGYLEVIYGCGIILNLLILVSTTSSKVKVTSWLTFGQLITCTFGFRTLSSLLFLSTLVIHFSAPDHSVKDDPLQSDLVSTFKPYEEEIRKYLLWNNPSLLHLVDTLLDRYAGREEILLEEIRENASFSASPANNARAAEYSATLQSSLNQLLTPSSASRGSFHSADIITVNAPNTVPMDPVTTGKPPVEAFLFCSEDREPPWKRYSPYEELRRTQSESRLRQREFRGRENFHAHLDRYAQGHNQSPRQVRFGVAEVENDEDCD
jgi:hypothetical protein